MNRIVKYSDALRIITKKLGNTLDEAEPILNLAFHNYVNSSEGFGNLDAVKYNSTSNFDFKDLLKSNFAVTDSEIRHYFKLTKDKLKQDSVNSDGFHVGIELETYVSGDDDGEHDDDACHESQLSYLNDMSTLELVEYCLGVSLSRSDADSLDTYLNTDRIIRDNMESFECSDYGDCGHYHKNSADLEAITENLVELTGNKSIKVVEDGSVRCDNDESSAEVCWNYFASKETITDNAKILEYLKDNGHKFNTSCGLHINLNNYLKISQTHRVPTNKLDFLFNFVGSSRRQSSYCNRFGVSSSEKYSMLYNQGDRIEFRFFSPTFEAVKLHHYVVLANTIYKKLAGKKCRLPKKSYEYFLNKMQKVNGLDLELAEYSLKMLDRLPSIETLSANVAEDGDASSESEVA